VRMDAAIYTTIRTRGTSTPRCMGFFFTGEQQIQIGSGGINRAGGQ